MQSTTVADYEAAVATMALAPVRLALAALPVMQAQGHGRIVSITSLGGKLGVPHLLPYCTAKFAAVGFSEGLRAELGRGPVTVTTVVPGLSMDAERAARQIVAGVAQRRPEIFLTPAGQVVSRLAQVAPGVTTAVPHAVQNLALPAPDGAAAGVRGRHLRGTLREPGFGTLASMGRAAAARFNQTGREPGPEEG